VSYATAQELIDRYGETELIQLTDREGLGVVDLARVNDALTAVSETIDGFVRRRYRLPLPATPGLLRDLCLQLARAALYTHETPPAVKEAADNALRLLERIGDGRLSLGLPRPGPVSAPPDHQAPGRVFTAASLEDYG